MKCLSLFGLLLLISFWLVVSVSHRLFSGPAWPLTKKSYVSGVPQATEAKSFRNKTDACKENEEEFGKADLLPYLARFTAPMVAFFPFHFSPAHSFPANTLVAVQQSLPLFVLLRSFNKYCLFSV